MRDLEKKADMNFDSLTTDQAKQLTTLKKCLQKLAQDAEKKKRGINFGLSGMVIYLLTERLTRIGRQTFLNWVFDHNPPLDSSKHFPLNEIAAITEWANPIKGEKKWLYSVQFIADLRMLQGVFREANSAEKGLQVINNILDNAVKLEVEQE